MATITAYSALNMDGIDLSNLYYSRPVSGTASRITVQYGTGYYGLFDGSFTYNQNYVPSGTLNTYSETYYGSTLYSIGGLSMSASTFLAYAYNRDNVGLQQAALNGPDRFNGSAGGDLVRLYEGADVAVGADGNDSLVAGNGADILLGNRGNDILFGEAGADTLFGGVGNDYLYAGPDNDVLWGDAGNDFLVGGTGSDLFVISAGGGDDAIGDFSFAGGDRIALVGVNAISTQGMTNGIIVGFDTGQTVQVQSDSAFSLAWFV